MTGKFLIVKDSHWQKFDILNSAETLEGALGWARNWATSHPGQTCYVLERHRTVASDALREVEG